MIIVARELAYTKDMTLYSTPQFSIDSHGAYLTRLVDKEGRPVLYERTEIDGKRRGGAHVCLPYFGPDAAGKLPQHGYGRDVEWDVTKSSDNEISCSLFQTNEDGAHVGLTANILYLLSPERNELYTGIVISNPFRRSEPQSVTPGFHPYFVVNPSDVRLNGKKIHLADYEPFKEFPDTPEVILESGGRTITVSSSNLQHMIVWTDAKGEYLCVEPTLMGNAFDSTKPGENILDPNNDDHMVQYGYTIKWS